MTDSYPNIEISAKRERVSFIIILSLAVILRFMFVIGTPAWHSADEFPHYWYAEEIAHTFKLPVSDGSFPVYESFQPPLYYLAASLPLMMFDERLNFSDQFQAPALQLILVRLLSLIASLFTIIITYRICKNIPILNSVERLTTVAFVSFLPTFVGVGSSVNNDSVVTLASSLCLFCIFRGKLTRQNVFLGGLFAGLALLTKLNSVILVPLIIYQLLKTEKFNYTRSIKKLSIGLAGLLAGIVLLLSFYMIQYNHPVVINPGVTTEFGLSFSELIRGLRNIIWSFWLAFGRSYRVRPEPVIYLMTALPLMLLAGYGWMKIKGERLKLIPSILIAIITSVTASLLYTALYPEGQMTSWGKNLYPLLPVIAIFFSIGWHAISRAWHSFFVPVVLIGLMLTGSLWGLITLWQLS